MRVISVFETIRLGEVSRSGGVDTEKRTGLRVRE